MGMGTIVCLVYFFLASSPKRQRHYLPVTSCIITATVRKMGAQQQEQQDVLDTIFSCQRSGLPFSKDTPVLICLAGFPDTASVWDPLVHRPELATSHHVIAMGLPGNHLNELPADHKWGYTIDEIQEALHRVVLYCHRNGAKIIHLLCHDWGANYGYLYVQEHKDEALVQKYAALDIGIFNPYQMPKVGMLKFIGYMLWFAFVFVTNNLIGSNMASKLIKVYPWKLIGPLNDEEVSGSIENKAVCVSYGMQLLLKPKTEYFSTDINLFARGNKDTASYVPVLSVVSKLCTGKDFLFQDQTSSSVLHVRNEQEHQLPFQSISKSIGQNTRMLVRGIKRWPLVLRRKDERTDCS